MKPPPFDYRSPTALHDVFEALAEAPGDVALLAGGQSLVPMLNMRLARPAIVVDLNGVEGLDEVAASNGHVRIGAMVRQRRLETDPVLRERVPLLAEAATHIAHVPIRTRGTVGGSLAHADPAAELPAAMLALHARLLLGRAGSEVRALPAEEFFVGPLMTAREPGEVVVGVELEAPPRGTGCAFREVARTHGAFALAGVAALVHVDASDRIDYCRIALCGIGGVPFAPQWLDDAVLGERREEGLFTHVAERVAGSIEPHGDPQAGPEYRRSVARVLTVRALKAAAANASEAA